MRRAPLFIATLLVASCDTRRPDFSVRGVGVALNTSVPFTRSPDFQRRIESTIDAALQYWNGNWDDLQGTTIVLGDDQYVNCNGSAPHALGCSEPGSIRITTRDLFLGTWRCVEETVLVHEIGHAVIGDLNHDDPRWMDFVPVLRALDGREGYTEAGETPCPLYISVWRHRLHSP